VTSHQATSVAAGAGDICLSDAGDDARSRECDELEPLNGGQIIRQKLMDKTANVGYRLGRRKALTERRKFVSDVALVCGLVGLVVITERRKFVSDVALVCGLVGLVVMIMETELCMSDVYTKVSVDTITRRVPGRRPVGKGKGKRVFV